MVALIVARRNLMRHKSPKIRDYHAFVLQKKYFNMSL